MPTPVAYLKGVLVGRPKETAGLEHERLSKKLALAVFSSDALSSSAYATEEMLLVLILGGVAALQWSIPLAIAITTVLGVVIVSYRQTVRAYPGGASAYIVASDNLGKWPGLVAASALLIDYTLTVAVSIAAGIAAVVSAIPGLAGLRVPLAIIAIGLVTVLNLRGVRESGVIFAIPTYAYILLIGSLVAWGLIRYAAGADPPTPTLEPVAGAEAVGLLLMLRAFSHGCTALTGVEAISDGVGAFRQPVARNAATTLAVMGVILAYLFVGLTILARLYGVNGPSEDPHRTVVSLIALSVFGEGTLFYLVQTATALILFLAANTSFADFPRLSAFLARDRYAPRQLLNRGDRLAFSNGIVALGALAAAVVLIYQADVSRIINLYVVGVFTSFTLSQSGMVVRWYRRRAEEHRWRRNAIVNGLGAFTTFVVLWIVLLTKFLAGAWIVTAAIPLIVWWLNKVNAHYRDVGTQLRREDRRPGPEAKNYAIVLVGRPSQEELRALAYAEHIGPVQLWCVHFAPQGQRKGVEAAWARLLGSVLTGPSVDVVPTEHDNVARELGAYLDRVRRRVEPDSFITVVVSERVGPGPAHTLGTPQALRIKTALLFKPGVVVTDVPYLEGKPQAALTLGRKVDHVVILLVSGVHNATLQALRYARSLESDQIRVLHVSVGDEEAARIVGDWQREEPETPIQVLASPYRRLDDPLRDYVRDLTRKGDTIVTLVLPEFVVRKSWHRLLHNQNALSIKWAFLREPNVVVTSVPFHLE